MSTFTPNNTAVNGPETEILSRPITFSVFQDDNPLSFQYTPIEIIQQTTGSIIWQNNGDCEPLHITTQAKMECDGYINYSIQITADSDCAITDVRLEIPYSKLIAQYMMGMGQKGGYRPQEYHWKWDINFANNVVWIGTINAGLQCKLKNKTLDWSLGTFKLTGLYYDWANDGKGGCDIIESDNDTVLLSAYTGSRELHTNETLVFNFGLLITPFKPLNPEHWNQRYFHNNLGNVVLKPSLWLKIAKFTGANIINVHHGNSLNPYINYPFYSKEKLKPFVEQATALHKRVKLYYTLRELTTKTAELWALRSLGNEIFTAETTSQPIGDNSQRFGNPWLLEHLIRNYDPAWHQPLGKGNWDMAIRTVGLSQWHNYYIEGLNWLVRNIGIKGLYLDGIGYDREIMKRVRKVLDYAAPDCLIDFHGGNEFAKEYGWNNTANRNLEHFPFLDSLWFGEGYDYREASPDYWLVEISGIPFGLYSEMLERGGLPFRGFVYGMTSRLGWTAGNPSPLWRLWDLLIFNMRI